MFQTTNQINVVQSCNSCLKSWDGKLPPTEGLLILDAAQEKAFSKRTLVQDIWFHKREQTSKYLGLFLNLFGDKNAGHHIVHVWHITHHLYHENISGSRVKTRLLGRCNNLAMVSNSFVAMWSLQRPVCQGNGVYLWCFWMSQDSSAWRRLEMLDDEPVYKVVPPEIAKLVFNKAHCGLW